MTNLPNILLRDIVRPNFDKPLFLTSFSYTSLTGKTSTFYQKYLPALNQSHLESLTFELPRSLQEFNDFKTSFLRFLTNQLGSLKSLTFFLRNEVLPKEDLSAL